MQLSLWAVLSYSVANLGAANPVAQQTPTNWQACVPRSVKPFVSGFEIAQPLFWQLDKTDHLAS